MLNGQSHVPDRDLSPKNGVPSIPVPLLHHTSPILLHMTHPTPVDPSCRYAAGIAALFAAMILALRAALIERGYSEAAVADPRSLVDAGSEFMDLLGVTVHCRGRSDWPLRWKEEGPFASASADGESQAASPVGNVEGIVRDSDSPCTDEGLSPSSAVLAMHCYHGFGANSFTLDESLNVLPKRLVALRGGSYPGTFTSSGIVGAMVTVHDMPGFGLTSRPRDLSSYSLAFNGKLGRIIQDVVVDRSGSHYKVSNDVGGPAPTTTASGCSRARGGTRQGASQPPRVRRALLGHSVGAVSAALQAIEGPQDVEFLVLLAPAILVMPGTTAPNGSGSILNEIVVEAAPDSCGGAAAGGHHGSNATGDAEESTARDERQPAAGAQAFVTRRLFALEPPAGSSSPSSAGFGAGPTLTLNNPPGGKDPPGGSVCSTGPEAAESNPRSMDQDQSRHTEPLDPSAATPIFSYQRPPLALCFSRVLSSCRAAVLLALLNLLRVLRPLSIALLRALVRNRVFWERGLQAAFYDKSCVTDEASRGYRHPGFRHILP